MKNTVIVVMLSLVVLLISACVPQEAGTKSGDAAGIIQQNENAEDAFDREVSEFESGIDDLESEDLSELEGIEEDLDLGA